ncbi:MAG: hypothetical protein KAY59_01155 [Acidobacteria bacterium]|uniref:hypothetical protein n=1 Tax=Sphingomonas sp. TaxID=28214 RepID=UPI001B48629F|nr:hypothetical protein [Sphingomonas sp.]MBP8273004.1 hypothetical protein [Acidobacteriota bacterium]
MPLSVPSLELQEKTLRQQQQIQALIAQNEALLARVRELETAPPVPPVPVPAVLPPAILQPVAAESVKLEPAPPPTPPAPIVPPPSAEPAILPNADGLIDLTALLIQTRDGDDVNPFAVRSLPADAIREVTLHVQGVIGGAAPCALINQRTVQPEQTIESLTLVGIEPNAVLVRHAGHLLRLPVAEKSVRIRLPL